MAVEVTTYRYVLRGKPVGTHVLKREPAGRYMQLEARSHFQGAFNNASTVQRSRTHARAFFSTRYEEANDGRNNRRNFQLQFDIAKGLVIASKGQRDTAEVPYLLPYRDPLSLLQELRNPELPDLHRIPMLGKEVIVRPRGITTIETIFGPTECMVYQLLPGPSYVYVMVKEPHHIVKLMQPTTEGVMETVLQTIGHEARLESSEPGGQRRRSRSKSPSRRRRPRRRKQQK